MARAYYLIGITKPAASGGLTYHAEATLAIGQIVEVTVRGRRQPGIVLEKVTKPSFATKPITRAIELPPLPPHLIELGRWLADYYVADEASSWQTLLPAGILKTRRDRPAAPDSDSKTTTLELTSEQSQVAQAIEASDLTSSLIRGVTGSGKTVVYQQLVDHQLAKGKSAIILVPEIALTPQTEQRFRQWFGASVIITHSRMTEAERFQVWQRALTSSEPLVVIGPRSALFLPLKTLGLIVIDECHETSYKQEQAPRFETTVTSAKLAHITGIKLVMGSATPGLREAYLAERGTIQRLDLTYQYNQLEAPQPIIIDLKDAAEFRANPVFSRTLLAHLDESLRNGRQSLLFLNRRGSASSQICTNCQHVTLCPNCRLPLVLHADEARMICHTCNFRMTPAAVCSNCGQATLRFLGIGTKRVADELAKLFPKARIARLDKDSLTRDSATTLYQQLTNHEIDFLIGTQMIAKGLDLPAMETVGVILADTSLYLPDYTATERTYDLLTQVSGRAGRGAHPGRTIIQTYSPHHPVIKALQTGNYWDFAAAELTERRLLTYPPFSYLLKLSYSHRDDASAERAAGELAAQLQSHADIQAIGPAPAFRHWAGGQSHWQIIVKAPRRGSLQSVARELPNGWTADLDPVNLL